jgi:hypothetical protein
MSQLKTIFEDIECTFEEMYQEDPLNILDNITLSTTLNNICLIKDDHEQSINLKIFLKENIEYVTSNNLIEELSNILLNNSESWYILINFYDLLKQKFNLILNLKTWKEIFINNFFWGLSTTDQINFLIEMKIYF